MPFDGILLPRLTASGNKVREQECLLSWVKIARRAKAAAANGSVCPGRRAGFPNHRIMIGDAAGAIRRYIGREARRRFRWTTRPAPSSKPPRSARLVAHLRERTDVQNIDLMNLAGFCRNCLSKWYRAAAEERGVALTDPQAREIVYGMPYDEWRKQYQKEATRRAEGRLRRRPAPALRAPAPSRKGEPCPMSGGLPASG